MTGAATKDHAVTGAATVAAAVTRWPDPWKNHAVTGAATKNHAVTGAATVPPRLRGGRIMSGLLRNPQKRPSEPIAGDLLAQYTRNSVNGVRMEILVNGAGLTTKPDAVGCPPPLFFEKCP